MCCTRRLVAQHLRLAARAVPHDQKLAFAAQEKVSAAAIADAKAQEAALLKRAANKQVGRTCSGFLMPAADGAFLVRALCFPTF